VACTVLVTDLNALLSAVLVAGADVLRDPARPAFSVE
jgi:hypothetical protein